ncbi:MAG: macro domain-containing protein [Planctomycetota bacterium]|nr:MAG: macro domain-containing protein [Planctomycetota bacterium]REJ89835.1 MAG: macro domain-containing protein [Planctomycetota bacterium]REK18028.1 MAG: macro domain-containing protein [Planctomycetota bacterium]REK42327.1 MAG: macro domain-containing protein [Planctomycetota bacterium]
MRVEIASTWLELVDGDITAQEVACVVNAANSRLAGGGGVDGAIHRAAGPTLMEETRRRYPEGCPTGSAVISSAGELAAEYVIHAVGPVWNGGQSGEAEQLAAAYRRALELAHEQACASIALPALSTGAYGYPVDLAARVALGTSIDFVSEHSLPSLVRFVLFGGGAYGAFAAALEELIAARQDY